MAAITLEVYKEDLSKSGNVLVFVGTEINCLNSKDPIYVQGRPSSRRFAHRASSSCHAHPTSAHLALIQLFRAGYVKYLMTENTDGMLIKAGADEESVIEINGNVHTEECLGCGLSFVREFCVQTSHCGIRTCQICGAKLQDTVISRNESPDIVLKESVSQAMEEAEQLLIIGSVPSSERSAKYFHPYLNRSTKVTCVSKTKPTETNVQWLQYDPAEFSGALCKLLNVEVLNYKIHRTISLIISKKDDQWLIRTNCVTSGGRHFSCLKGVDVIPCIENEELEEDPEVLCYDPYQCVLPMSDVINKCHLEIYYIFFGFNQEPEWSVGVPISESSHVFELSCNPGDMEWTVQKH
ncbi:uncharacterized protein LOC134822265 isoform X2 [Bolinopsis microptera]|uniref:uncharacterized protein LOC134822265 isoform X2 n=1 Tax=Bolinopsis microptera TaxID=2820187 RepID=UPI00307A048E